MKNLQPVVIAAATLAGLFGFAGPASAALSVTLSPADAVGDPNPSTSFEFGLDVAGLEDLGIDISDAPALTAFVRFVQAGVPAATAPLSVTSVSAGDFFATLFNPVAGIKPAVGGETPLDVQYSAFNSDTLETVPLPTGGRFVSFTVSPTALATPGTWNVEAYLVVDNEEEPAVLSNVTSATITLVPEPETYALFAAGLVALGVGLRRRPA